MYVIIGILIKLSGTAWLMKLLPPVVVGPVIMVIGLSLAPTAVNMAMYENPGDMKGYNISFLNCCNDNLACNNSRSRIF